MQLIDLINLTDFICLADCCSLFEIDSLKLCDSAIRQENAKNYEFEFRQVELKNLEESLRAKHLTKDINMTTTGNKTLFVRSRMTVQTNHRLLLFLYFFGLKTVHDDSARILKQLQTEFGRTAEATEDFSNSKLYGLYRSRDERIRFASNAQDKQIY